MENQELKITVEAGIKELVIREGEAEVIKYKQPQAWDGTIGAPSEFYAVRKDQVRPESAVVVYDLIEMSIKMFVDKSDELAPVISGKLSTNPDLLAFNINSESGRKKSKELSNLLRMRRIFFKSKEECDAVVNQFMNFKTTVTHEIEKANDLKGSQKEKLESSLAEKIDIHFTLNMPIFKGEKKHEFLVEVMCEISGSDVLFWLESQELQELTVSERERIILEEVGKFDTLVTIQK